MTFVETDTICNGGQFGEGRGIPLGDLLNPRVTTGEREILALPFQKRRVRMDHGRSRSMRISSRDIWCFGVTLVTISMRARPISTIFMLPISIRAGRDLGRMLGRAKLQNFFSLKTAIHCK